MPRTLVVIGLAAALVLAGCAGPGGEGVNDTANETGNDTGAFGNETNDTGVTDNDTALGNDTGNDTGLGNDTNASVAAT